MHCKVRMRFKCGILHLILYSNHLCNRFGNIASALCGNETGDCCQLVCVSCSVKVHYRLKVTNNGRRTKVSKNNTESLTIYGYNTDYLIKDCIVCIV
jgi:hypothetical protein